MSKISNFRHRTPFAVMHRSVWLYFRLPLSFRDVGEMLAECGIDVSYETARRKLSRRKYSFLRRSRGLATCIVPT